VFLLEFKSISKIKEIITIYTMMTKEIVSRRLIQLLLIVGGLLFHSGESHKASYATTPTKTKAKASSIAASVALQTTTIKPEQIILQILEKEIYDSESDTWRGRQPSRWMDPNGAASLAPPNIPAPTVWIGQWKIVTSQHRDALGWEYTWLPGQPPVRQRIWLRTYLRDDGETSLVTTHQHPISSLSLSLLWTRFQQDFTFKGWGMNLYQSCVATHSRGIALRLPITSNWNWWERHPALPSFTATGALYYPWCLIGYISCNINVDYLIWAMESIVRLIQATLWYGLLYALKAVALPFAILLVPLTRSIILPSFTIPSHHVPKPQQSSQVQEKVGCSISWRYSLAQGYEFRVSQYYLCLPTLVYLVHLTQQILGKIQQHAPHPLVSFPLLDWFRTKTGSIGISLGQPTKAAPGFTCNAVLSLNGFHVRQKQHQVLQKPQQQQQQQWLEVASTPRILVDQHGAAAGTATALAGHEDSVLQEEQELGENVESKRKGVTR
jgi:hypothetical protein